MGPGSDAQVHLGPQLPVLAVGHGIEGDVEAARSRILFEDLTIRDDIGPTTADGQLHV